jgi:hypothetical protein
MIKLHVRTATVDGADLHFSLVNISRVSEKTVLDGEMRN